MPNPLPLLLETIKIEEGNIHNFYYHQQRLNNTLQSLFNTSTQLNLEEHIKAPPRGCYRCRILYTDKIHSVEYIPYTPKSISILHIIEADITYPYKYANRTALDILKTQLPSSDEILILKDGYLTDTSIANVALYDGKTWYTPKDPLLAGTMRKKLLTEGHIKTKEIKEENLSEYTQVALMNAMIGFRILKNITIVDTQGKIYDY